MKIRFILLILIDLVIDDLEAFYAPQALSILILSWAISSADFRRPKFCMLSFSTAHPATPQFETT